MVYIYNIYIIYILYIYVYIYIVIIIHNRTYAVHRMWFFAKVCLLLYHSVKQLSHGSKKSDSVLGSGTSSSGRISKDKIHLSQTLFSNWSRASPCASLSEVLGFRIRPLSLMTKVGAMGVSLLAKSANVGSRPSLMLCRPSQEDSLKILAMQDWIKANGLVKQWLAKWCKEYLDKVKVLSSLPQPQPLKKSCHPVYFPSTDAKLCQRLELLLKSDVSSPQVQVCLDVFLHQLSMTIYEV